MDATVNQTAPLIHAKHLSLIQIVTLVLYSIIILLSTVGNLIIILTVIRSAALRTVTNIFIANLAVADLLMTFISAPFTPLAFYMEKWRLPWIFCHLLSMTMGTILYVSTLTSTAIAVDRFLVIVHPFVTRMSNNVVFLIITIVWIFAIVVSLPLAIYQEVIIDPISEEVTCSAKWPQEKSQVVFTIVTFVLQFVVPCLIISVCYYRVCRALRVRCELRIGFKNREKELAEVKRKKRTTKMLIAMVVIFVICWIPLHTFWMIVDTSQKGVDESDTLSKAFIWCHILAMSSAVYNPFFYAWLNNNFRQEFKTILQCLRCCRAHSPPQGTNVPRRTVTFVPSTTPNSKRSEENEGLAVAESDGGVWLGPNHPEQIVEPQHRRI